MTPTTPSGWYSSVAAWLMATRPLRTRRGRSTFRALRAAQSMCTIASRISSWASAERLAGLGVHELGQPPDVPGQVRLPGEQPGPPLGPGQARPPGRGLVRALDRRGHVVFAEHAEGGDDLGCRRVQRVKGLRGPRRALRPQRRDHGSCTTVLCGVSSCLTENYRSVSMSEQSAAGHSAAGQPGRGGAEVRGAGRGPAGREGAEVRGAGRGPARGRGAGRGAPARAAAA